MKAPNTEVVNDKCAVILCGKKKKGTKNTCEKLIPLII